MLAQREVAARNGMTVGEQNPTYVVASQAGHTFFFPSLQSRSYSAKVLILSEPLRTRTHSTDQENAMTRGCRVKYAYRSVQHLRRVRPLGAFD